MSAPAEKLFPLLLSKLLLLKVKVAVQDESLWKRASHKIGRASISRVKGKLRKHSILKS